RDDSGRAREDGDGFRQESRAGPATEGVGLIRAVALTCARCSGRLMAAPGVSLGGGNSCSTAWDFSSGGKRPLPVEGGIAPLSAAGEETLRLPFIRVEADGAGSSGSIYVMAFAISKIGTPFDDGSKLTMEAKKLDVRPGGVDLSPEIGLETATGLA